MYYRTESDKCSPQLNSQRRCITALASPADQVIRQNKIR